MPAPNYNLQINFNTPGLDDLENRIPSVMQKIRSEITATNAELKNFSSAMQGLSRSSGTIADRLDKATKGSQQYGKSLQDLKAQIAEATRAQEEFRNSLTNTGRGGSQAGAEIGRSFSSSARGGLTEARWAAQLLGEELGLRLPRAITSLIAQSGALGVAIRAALPTGVAIFFGLEIGKVTVKVLDLYQNMMNLKSANEALSKSGTAGWDAMLQSIEATHKATERYIQLTQGAGAADRYRMRTMGEDLDYKFSQVPTGKDLKYMSSEGKESVATAFQDVHGINELGDRLTQLEDRRKALEAVEKNYSQLHGAPGSSVGSNRFANGVDTTRSLTDIQTERKGLDIAAAQLIERLNQFDAERKAERAQTAKDDQKEATKAQRPEDQMRNILARVEEAQNKRLYPESMFGNLGTMELQRQRDVREINNIKDLNPKDRSSAIGSVNYYSGLDMRQEAQRVSVAIKERNNAFGAEGQKEFQKSVQQSDRELRNNVFGIGGRNLEDADREFRERRQRLQLEIQRQSGSIERSYAERGAMRQITGTGSPGQDYEDAISKARELLALQAEDIKQEADGIQKELDAKKSLYDFVAQQDEARIEREKQIAEIGAEQQKKAGEFFSGLFDAAISHEPSATSRYLSGFGRSISSTIVNNAGQALTGSGGLNNFFSLDRGGLLGTPDQRSLIGTLVKGTPLDFSAKELEKYSKQAAAHTPLIDSQNALKNSIDALTAAIGGRPPAGSSSISSIGGVSTSGVSGLMNAVKSGNPLSILSSAAGLASSVNGGSTRSGASGAASMLPAIVSAIGQGGTPPFLKPGGPSMSFGPDMSVLASLGSTMPNGTGSGPGINPIQDLRNSIRDLASSTGDMAEASSPAINSIQYNSAYHPGLGAIPGVSARTKISDFLNKGAGLIGTTGKMLASGDALEGVLTGKIDYGDGTGEALGTSQRIAGGIGLGAATYAGVSSAVKDFSRGGARNAIGGVGKLAGTAAMYDPDPFSKSLLAGGAAALGLIQSLFPDPRAERVKEEQRTLVNDQYIRPAARDYSFAGGEGGGGFSTGMGGALRAGGPSANYANTIHINALDAKSFADLAKSDPTAFGQAVMTSITDGGIGALSSEIAYRSQYGGYIYAGGLSG